MYKRIVVVRIAICTVRIRRNLQTSFIINFPFERQFNSIKLNKTAQLIQSKTGRIHRRMVVPSNCWAGFSSLANCVNLDALKVALY